MVLTRSCRRSGLLLCWLLTAALPALAQEVDLQLVPPHWDVTAAQGAQVAWGPGAALLATELGTQCYAIAKSKQAIAQDFEASVAFEMVEWSPGLYERAAFGFGLVAPGQAINMTRVWDGAVENYTVGITGQNVYGYPASAMAVTSTGRLKFVRRGAAVQAIVEEDQSQHTLQMHTLRDRSAPLNLQFVIGNGGAGNLTFPSLQVKLWDLQVKLLPPLPRRGGGADQPAPAGAPEWTIYSTGPGWLRVGSIQEFEAPWEMRHEIFGGNSTDPLPKKLLRRGFPDRKSALEYLCDRLTRVRVVSSPLATPHEYVEAMFDQDNYNLRLEGGVDLEDTLPRGMEYDFAAERKILAEHGLTPRRFIGRLWLIHILGHGTREGFVTEDQWVLFSGEPLPDPKQPQQGYFLKPDGFGGTFTYLCDEWIGPFRDDFGLAVAMSQRNIDQVELYPPGNRFTPTIYAGEIPKNPRDYGSKVAGVQPIVDPPELKDWVVYVTADRWLHIGTRTEFSQPVAGKDTIWGGNGDEAVKKKAVDFGQPFRDYAQALETVLAHVSDVTIGYHPNADPREAVHLKFGDVEVISQMARSPYQVVAGYRQYNLRAEIDLMLAHGKVPVKRFGAQYLVHATGHGTYSGPVKDDHWMMVTNQPQNGGVTIPDGTGGTFGYSVDQVQGPFTDSLTLAKALQALNLKYVNLAGGYVAVSVDDVLVPKPPPKPKATQILSLTPDRGEAGESFYITVVAEGMKPWYSFTFGPGVVVTDPTCLGVDPETGGERWLATLTIAEGASFRGQ